LSIWSRIVEFVTDVGGSLAAALQRLVEPKAPEKSLAFTIGMIALSAKMARADGEVTGAELRAFRQIFHVPPEEAANVERVFNLAKQDMAGYDAYARQIAKLFGAAHAVLEDVLDGLFHIAKADHVVGEAELEYLRHVAEIFGFSPAQFRVIKLRHVFAPCDACEVLGVRPDADDELIRKRYKQLVRENHPDRHIAAGMPSEFIDIATAKLAAINAAYEELARERGL
jgi:DnaJ like chaperone protein